MATQPLQLPGPKRPRLSLQIKTSCSASPPSRPSRGYAVNPSDPTAFNTLSNVYVTAIERANSEPLTAINTIQTASINTAAEYKDIQQRVVTPYVASYPETPVTAHSDSPQRMEFTYPSSMTMTATPPMSAGPVEPGSSNVFSFSKSDTANQSQSSLTSPIEGRTTRRRMPTYQSAILPPYTHPHSLHSILRNSPLPPITAIPPPSPRRQSLRLQEKAAKRVGYNNPLTQEIVTNKYIKSHIDLLAEEASPNSPSHRSPDTLDALDLSLAFAPNEIQDGGQTPGPFEDMRRRMAGLKPSSPLSAAESGGIRKRKKKEKKRRWVWTIGQEEGDEEEVGGAIAALRAAAARDSDIKTEPEPQPPTIGCVETPTPTIERFESESITESADMDISDASSVISETSTLDTHLNTMDVDAKTPTAPLRASSVDAKGMKRDTPIPELSEPQDATEGR